MRLFVLIVLLAVIGTGPWSYSERLSYDPSGGLWMLLVVVTVFALARAPAR